VYAAVATAVLTALAVTGVLDAARAVGPSIALPSVLIGR
jgi:hypothetical protein